MWLKHLKTEVDVDDKVMFYVGIVTKYLKRGTITGFKKDMFRLEGKMVILTLMYYLKILQCF